MCVKSQISSFYSFRDMRGSRIYTMGRCIPGTSTCEKLTPLNEYLTLPKCM